MKRPFNGRYFLTIGPSSALSALRLDARDRRHSVHNGNLIMTVLGRKGLRQISQSGSEFATIYDYYDHEVILRPKEEKVKMTAGQTRGSGVRGQGWG